MDREEFEKCSRIAAYDEFMGAALDYDSLSMEDYKSFMPVLFEIVPARPEKDPVDIYDTVIEELRKRWTASEELPFHGPWHHGMIAGIIVAALRNNGYDFTDADVSEALKRGLMIPAGACGFHGSCGAATGLGIALSIVTRSTPFHGHERSYVLKASSEAIARVARMGGPRCCALSAYATLSLAAKKLGEMGYELPSRGMAGICSENELNPQCHLERCPYYPR
ncbi:MAG: DUF5714 domain-containing protein [Actinomycetota bacterium]|nr:DUF5714 domain-containing protein [Actinomycetota bacterium]